MNSLNGVGSATQAYLAMSPSGATSTSSSTSAGSAVNTAVTTQAKGRADQVSLSEAGKAALAAESKRQEAFLKAQQKADGYRYNEKDAMAKYDAYRQRFDQPAATATPSVAATTQSATTAAAAPAVAAGSDTAATKPAVNEADMARRANYVEGMRKAGYSEEQAVAKYAAYKARFDRTASPVAPQPQQALATPAATTAQPVAATAVPVGQTPTAATSATTSVDRDAGAVGQRDAKEANTFLSGMTKAGYSKEYAMNLYASVKAQQLMQGFI